MKIWPIAAATVLAVVLAASVAGAEPAPVRVGVVLNALDNPFFVAMYEGVTTGAGRLGARVAVRAATSNSDLAGEAGQLGALVAGGEDCYVVNPITATNLVPPLRGVRRP